MWRSRSRCSALGIDYVRVRTNLYELERLRVETREQRDQIQTYAEQMEAISTKLARIDGFERKLRIITNLDPADPLPLPGIGGTDGEMLSADDVSWMSRGKRNEVMKEGLETLAGAMDAQDESLQGLIHHLEDQSARLVHTPSITPTHGWITSHFGYRMDPYTGARAFHKGLDIAGRMGTPVFAAADGEVIYSTQKSSLGYAVKLRHGYNMETVYGHLQQTMVKPGETVKRGQQIGLHGLHRPQHRPPHPLRRAGQRQSRGPEELHPRLIDRARLAARRSGSAGRSSRLASGALRPPSRAS